MSNSRGGDTVSVQDIMERTLKLIARKQQLATAYRDHLAELGRKLLDAARRNDFQALEDIKDDISSTMYLWSEVREAKSLDDLECIEDE